ncbi:phytanoyl-CoA dioxygenase [Coccomyxa subellipsoidea C-169]|uniref:Phytanoyl-CoA dioxygenase n=1 Tax=Coccomyxa subellipsoidea (strain C-169) TaxID=574566 RepID=I0Z287_COCSC|nr:phytanoyl-CoA dioxygenase [Coccomyxa subellipsoidea C-169]EIE24756.1 phytanoyl-CoA dioxygenase [Coccomyxa subellipsoidea C-169]|eukprot:XP_005649300.1 phytanoyl-CoA dioxygenase [Coccomyxa subellipsoidea C-169]
MQLQDGGLSQQKLDQFQRDGFLVLEGFASPDEVADLRQRAGELVEGFEPATRSVFSTKSQASTTDDYFLESANNISFFFEENAFQEDGKLRQDKALSINKIGHALHDADPAFRSFSRSQKVAQLISSLGFKRPLPVQSMYIFKQPKIGGEVRPHQDSTFLYTDPPSVVGLWWALEDATRTNGCLWAHPGSHASGVARRFLKTPDNKVTFDKDVDYLQLFNKEEFVPLEVPSGSLVLLHGANVHFSYENQSGKSRHAYSMHVIEGASSHNYSPDNW